MIALLECLLHVVYYLFAGPTLYQAPGLPFGAQDASTLRTLRTNTYDPSIAYQGTAVVEVWIGQEPVNVGDIRGSDLYHEIQSALESACTDSENGLCGASNERNASFRTLYSAGRNQVQNSLTHLTIEDASYIDALTRNMLIAIIARTLQASVKSEKQNCYKENGICFCNVGNVVRVNMHENGVKNYMHVRLHGEQAAKGRFECCETLGSVDSAVDTFNAHVERVYGRYSRDVRCITEGFGMCEGRVVGGG
ncbi:hypothetical protein NX059_009856 [Plenodomus lindquistii]|nr:hypothetical protein NX059_009856 [Plenodomus lindquistii]